jgi:hypothetical protein
MTPADNDDVETLIHGPFPFRAPLPPR